MAVQRLVGLKVTDEEGYRRYRAEMTPLLEARGGGFVLDLRVSEVLRSPGDAPINRLFIIRFPDARTLEEFFSDPAYLAVRERHFDSSVGAVAELARFMTDD